MPQFTRNSTSSTKNEEKKPSTRPHERTRTRRSLRDDIVINECDIYYTTKNQRQKNALEEPKVKEPEVKRAINTGLSKDEALNIINQRLDVAATHVYTTQRTNPVEKFSIDEKGFVNFARRVFQHLQYLDNHSDKFCSEFEFVYYSVVMLKTQQVARYGVSNIRNVFPGDAKDFVTTMTGRKYPAVFDEYFKCLGTVTMKGGLPLEMETTFPTADATQDEPGDVDYDPSAYVDDALIDITKFNDVLNVLSTDDYHDTLRSRFNNPVFTTLSRGRSSRYKDVIYSADDPHFTMPFDNINVKLLDNVDGYLSLLSGKYELSTFEDRPISVSIAAEYDNVAQIRVHNSSDYSRPPFLTSREAQCAPDTLIAAMFRLVTDDVIMTFSNDYADNEAFSVSIGADINVLIEKLIASYDTQH